MNKNIWSFWKLLFVVLLDCVPLRGVTAFVIFTSVSHSNAVLPKGSDSEKSTITLLEQDETHCSDGGKSSLEYN